MMIIIHHDDDDHDDDDHGDDDGDNGDDDRSNICKMCCCMQTNLHQRKGSLTNHSEPGSVWFCMVAHFVLYVAQKFGYSDILSVMIENLVYLG